MPEQGKSPAVPSVQAAGPVPSAAGVDAAGGGSAAAGGGGAGGLLPPPPPQPARMAAESAKATARERRHARCSRAFVRRACVQGMALGIRHGHFHRVDVVDCEVPLLKLSFT